MLPCQGHTTVRNTSPTFEASDFPNQQPQQQHHQQQQSNHKNHNNRNNRNNRNNQNNNKTTTTTTKSPAAPTTTTSSPTAGSTMSTRHQHSHQHSHQLPDVLLLSTFRFLGMEGLSSIALVSSALAELIAKYKQQALTLVGRIDQAFLSRSTPSTHEFAHNFQSPHNTSQNASILTTRINIHIAHPHHS